MAYTLPDSVFANRTDEHGQARCWDTQSLQDVSTGQVSPRTLERALAEILPTAVTLGEVTDDRGRGLNRLIRDQLDAESRKKRWPSLIIQQQTSTHGHLLMANDGRAGRKWLWCASPPDASALEAFLGALARQYEKPMLIWPHGLMTRAARDLLHAHGSHEIALASGGIAHLALTAYPSRPVEINTPDERPTPTAHTDMTHLDRLEADSIHIIREVIAEAEKPVMLYSIGKDSSVMLRLAEKAFYPSRPPFPLMHVDTRWKFQAMYEFRARIAETTGMDLIVHINPEGVEKNINPFDHGSALHTDVMKTQGLIQALDQHGFDAAFGGARRDEEKSRAKERVFSFRNSAHRWDPKNQRPELWNLYNGRKAPGESIRVFPLSNWTELDIWQYIYRENIPIVPLYFATERPVIERDGMLMLVDDERLKLFPGERIHTRKVRFRTLGCYPLTGAIESNADTLPKILLELLEARTSERQGRAIDSDSVGSMEKKKQEGYF